MAPNRGRTTASSALAFLILPFLFLSKASVAKKDDEYDPIKECTLFLAESSIPNAGWGMYTGKALAKGEVIGPTDVAIQVADQALFMELYKNIRGSKLPLWKIHDYFWNPDITYAEHEGKDISSIIPGLGMAANSHTGLVNVENKGTLRRASEGNNGAYTHFTEQTFKTYFPLPVGHELFAEYGDNWFADRFGGDFPLSRDFGKADKIVKSFLKIATGGGGDVEPSHSVLEDIWNITIDYVSQFSTRLTAALPSTLEQVFERKGARKRSAYITVPEVIRTLPWLQEHGLCMDHITSNKSNIEAAGMGAFAARDLPKDTIVSPVPVIPLAKDHLKVIVPYDTDHRKRIRHGKYDHEQIWEGYQLLLNYVYGHPSTSLVFFPYATAVNLINHRPNSTEPNVELRWSSREPPVFDQTPSELLEKPRTFLMELVALKDIKEGEEIVLDYGSAWQEAWDTHDHVQTDTNFTSAWSYAQEDVLRTEDSEEGYYPEHVEVFCWYDFDPEETVETILERGRRQEVRKWKLLDTSDIYEADRCLLTSQYPGISDDDDDEDDNDEIILYTARILEEPEKDDDPHVVIVENIPRSSIVFRDVQYSSPQYRRQAFRHEIQLPEDMIPQVWKDMDDVETPCSLYVAESSIPNAGLGIFSGVDIPASKPILPEEIVIQVEDSTENQSLRSWFYGSDGRTDPPPLLDNYYWSSMVTKASYEAEEIQSVVPGIGMLANSHSGLVNVELRPPQKSDMFSRIRDPAAGAVSDYHSAGFVSSDDISAGSEIFVSYGDDWFTAREEEYGPIPLLGDYMTADSRLEKFWDIVDEDPHSRLAHDLWDFMTDHPWKDSEVEHRVQLALPKTLEEVSVFVKEGCARASLHSSARSTEWLQEHGTCVDNIRPGMSSLSQAGRGAFATRRMLKDTTVALVPMVHLDRRYTQVWTSEKNPETRAIRPKYLGEQLIKNYVYGHPESSVILFPTSPAVNYINHNSTNANVELRWSNTSSHQSAWLDMLPVDLMKQDRSGLVMELVALSNISPNQEILLDYGALWESAWKKHAANFTPPTGAEDYVPASHFNDFFGWIDPGFTPPENVFVGCYVNPRTIRRIGGNTEILEFTWRSSPNIFSMSRYVHRCEVVQRDERHPHSELRKDTIMPQDIVYQAKVYYDEHNDPDAYWLVHNIPRRAIECFDRNYTSNQFLRNAFRHEIGLPDHLVPEAWRDLRDQNEDHDEL